MLKLVGKPSGDYQEELCKNVEKSFQFSLVSGELGTN